MLVGGDIVKQEEEKEKEKLEAKAKPTRELKTVYQANPLLQSKKDYGILEHRLLRLAIADVRPHLKNSMYFDNDFKTFHLSSKELLEYFKDGAGGDSHSLYDKLVKSCQSMGKKTVELKINKGVKVIPVFEYIEFTAQDGLYIKFNRAMMPYLIELEGGNYTRTLLGLSFSLNSVYSLTLLELMLQYQGTAKFDIVTRKISLEELKFSMNVPEDAYNGRIDNFRHKVIDSAIKDINANTDYEINPKYEIIRGKFNKVTGFIFKLKLPPEKSEPDEVYYGQDAKKESLIYYLCSHGIPRRTAERLAEQENAQKNLEIALKYIDKGFVKNPRAYIRMAIEEDWYKTKRNSNWFLGVPN